MYIKIFIMIILLQTSLAKEYKLSYEKESSIVIPASIILGASFLIDNSEVSESEIKSLNFSDINIFDRSAVEFYSKNAAFTSDILLYSSLISPMLLFADNKARDNAFEIITMTGEVFLINNALTLITKNLAGRYRPYAYNSDVSIDEKLNTDVNKSFFSGHSSNTFAFMVLTAKLFTELHPDSKYNPYVWTLCLGVATSTGLLRYFAGKHFPTDIITGAIVGSAVGYIIPEIHRSNSNISINTFQSQKIISLNLNF